jgi:hypothetical protein
MNGDIIIYMMRCNQYGKLYLLLNSMVLLDTTAWWG